VVARETAERLQPGHVDTTVLVKVAPDMEAHYPADYQVVGAEPQHPVQDALHAYSGLPHPRRPYELAGRWREARLLELVGLGRVAI
jgi:hypothetical protein